MPCPYVVDHAKDILEEDEEAEDAEMMALKPKVQLHYVWTRVVPVDSLQKSAKKICSLEFRVVFFF